MNPPPLIVDTHAHLDFPDFDRDRDEVLARAHDAGVRFVLCAGTSLETSRRCGELAGSDARLHWSAGVHPHEAATLDAAALADLEALAGAGAAAVGEVGLDFFRDRSPRSAQMDAFVRQLELAATLDLPVIVHSREAWEPTLDILRRFAPPKKGVIHCFGGGPAEAAEAQALGFYASFGGPVTYKKADRTRSAAAAVRLERLLLETDAPYLAPQSRRGKRNEPAWIVEAARKLADLHDLPLDDLAAATTANARDLFGMGPPIPKERIAYAIGNGLYLNLTNRCTARCAFCVREIDPVLGPHQLRLPAEPTASEVEQAVAHARPGDFAEIVFCGFGEPTLRLQVLLAVGESLRRRGHRVRLNTNGMANLHHGRDVTPQLAKAVDEVSVSLNAQDASTYTRLCRPRFGDESWASIVDFIEKARGRIGKVTATVVDGQEGVDVEACRALAQGLGADFRVRGFRGDA